MQLNVTTDYAIRIVLYLADKGRLANSDELSAQMGIPRTVIATISAPLQKAGILTAQRGAGGGFALGRRPEDISLYELINTMEETTRINRCLEKDSYCSRGGAALCPLHRFYIRIQSYLDETFREMTVASLLEDA